MTLEKARKIATEICKEYGEFDDAGWDQFNTIGIWNDHPAVQAALKAFKVGRIEGLKEGHNIAEKNGAFRSRAEIARRITELQEKVDES